MHIAAYLADIARGDGVTRPLDPSIGIRERWFRHPYLEMGASLEAHAAVDGWLATHGYTVAPVSMENHDWIFTELYDRELARHHSGRAAAIRQAYLECSAHVFSWYRQAAAAVVGREPAYILLLHASRLNSASVDALAVVLRTQQHEPASAPALPTADS